MPEPDTNTNSPAVTENMAVSKLQTVDSGSTVYKLVAFALMLIFLTVLSYLSASNFDGSELKLIGGMAVVTLLVLFAPDLARRYLPGGNSEK